MQKEEYAKAFGEHLKSLINEKGITQKELAEKTELTEAAVSRYIKGDRVPGVMQACRIACGIGVDMNTLTNVKGEKYDPFHNTD